MRKFLQWTILTLLVAGVLPVSVYAARTQVDWVNLSGTSYIQPNFGASGVDLLILGSSRYVNFNTVTGTSGYGFRDNGGIMQWKNSGGSWANIGSGGGGGSSGGTWATSTSQVSGQLVNYPNNTTDVVVIGAQSTTTANYYIDPNIDKAVLKNASTTLTSATTFFSGAGSVSAPAFWVSGAGGLYKRNTSEIGLTNGVSSVGWDGTSLVPGTTDARDLGSIGNRWDEFYGSFVRVTAAGGTATTTLFNDSTSHLVVKSATTTGNLTQLTVAAPDSNPNEADIVAQITPTEGGTRIFEFDNQQTATGNQVDLTETASGGAPFSNWMFQMCRSGNCVPGYSFASSGAQAIGVTASNLLDNNALLQLASSTVARIFEADTVRGTHIFTIYPTGFVINGASSTINGNATTTGMFESAVASSTKLYGAGLTLCQSGNVLTYDGAGKFGCATDATGGGGSFPFTPTAYGVSTSTTVGFTNGILSTASSTFTATSTHNAISVVPNGSVSASVSVGGAFNLTNTVNDGAGMILFTNHASGATGRLLSVDCGSATFDQNCVNIQSGGTASTLNIQGANAGLGVVKVAGLSGGASNNSGSLMSLDSSVNSFMGQGLFVKCNSGTTTPCAVFRDASSNLMFSVDGNKLTTMINASSSALTNSGSNWLTGVTASSLLSLDSNQKVVPTTTPTALNYIATSGTATSSFAGNVSILGNLWQNGAPIGTTTKIIWIDSNRLDTYIPDGSINRPYKTITTANTGVTASGIASAAYYIAPGTYSEQSMTMPNIPLVIQANNASIIMLSGASLGAGTLTLTSDFSIYDATIFGNVNATASSLTNPHNFTNSFIVGSARFAGLAFIANTGMADQSTVTYPFLSQSASSSFTSGIGSIINVVGSQINVVVDNNGFFNLNDSGIFVSTSSRYVIVSTTTSSSIAINGATIINYGTGGGINCANSATAAMPNEMTNFSVTLGNGSTNGIDCGTAKSYIEMYLMNTFAGTVMYATGSQLNSLSNAGLNVEGNSLLNVNGGLTAVGTSTPFWALTVASSTGPQIGLVDKNPGNFAWTMRSINNNLYFATSTATATSTASAFAINSNGGVTIDALRNCDTVDTNSSGLLVCGTDATGAGGGSWPFTTTDTNFGQNVQSTTTALWLKASPVSIMASGTAQFVFASTTQLSASTGICINGDCRTAWPSAGSGAWPFNPDFYNALPAQSTTTPLWLKNTIVIASTTYFTNASTTGLTIGGTSWFTGLTGPGPLAIGPDGKTYVAATTTAANPSGSIGSASATNGTAATYMRSDAAPACTAATASVPGCLAAADFTTFNGKLSFANIFGKFTTYSTSTVGTTTSMFFPVPFYSSSTPSLPAVIDNVIIGNSTTTNATTTNMAVSGTASTSRILVSNLKNCDTIDTDATGLLTCGTDATGSGAAWPFTTDSYNAVLANSTTTNLWIKGGMLIASTTYFTNASTTGLTNTGSTWLTGVTASSLLALDSAQKIVATTTPTALNYIATSAGATSTFAGALYVGTTTNGSGANIPYVSLDTGTRTSEEAFMVAGSVNDFFENNIKNASAGAAAQGCWTSTNNGGTLTTGFLAMCANSTGFWTPAAYNVGGASDTSIMSLTSGDFYIDQATAGKAIRFMVGGNSTTTFSGNETFNMAGATTTSYRDFRIATTSGSAFNIADRYGSTVVNVNTASTTSGYDLLELFSATSSGPLFAFDQFGHMTASSTAPTLSSCGTSPSISSDSSDFSGTITVGSVAATACTLTFGTAHTIGTHCVISEQTGSVVNASSYTEGLTGFTYSQTGLTSDKLDYICTGK